jgi:hypothetical protein
VIDFDHSPESELANKSPEDKSPLNGIISVSKAPNSLEESKILHATTHVGQVTLPFFAEPTSRMSPINFDLNDNRILGILNVIARAPAPPPKKELREGNRSCDEVVSSETEDSPEKTQQKLDHKIFMQKSSDLVTMGKLINRIKGRIPNEIQINDDEPDSSHGHLVIGHDPLRNAINKKIENLPLNLKLGVIQLEKAKDAMNLDAKKISNGLSKKFGFKEAIRFVRRMERERADLGRKLEGQLLLDKKKSDAVHAKVNKEIKRVTEVWDNKGPQDRARLEMMEKYSKETILARK